MKQFLLRIIERTPLRSLARWAIRKRLDRAIRKAQVREFVEWERTGKVTPAPHLAKQQTLRLYTEKYCTGILVETGTYQGDMVEAMRCLFDRVYSIELSETLFEIAKERFRRVKNVFLICGDSAVELGKVIHEIDRPALFWPDGHYSGGVTARGRNSTPIYEELNHILSSSEKHHVIVIDDARLFGTDAEYPSMKELGEYVESKDPEREITVQDDMIRITPKQYPS